MNLAARIAVPVLLAGLAGCNGIGEGTTLESLQVTINQQSTTADQGYEVDDENLTMYQCFCTNLAAVTTFSDGTTANFVNRVKWTVLSSNPEGAIRVFNGADENFFKLNDTDADSTLCSGTQRDLGVLIADQPGTAVVQAEFAGITDTINVTALAIPDGSIVVRPSDPLIAAAVGDGDIPVAVGTALDLATYFTVDGREREVFGSTWALAPVPAANQDIITFDSNSQGRMTGVKRDGGVPQTATATFPICGESVSRTVRSGDVVALTLANDPVVRTDPDDSNPLIENTNELLQITGGLDYDGDLDVDAEQNLRSATGITVYELCSTIRCTGTVGGTCGPVQDDQFCVTVKDDKPASVPVCSSVTSPDPAVAICRTAAARFSASIPPLLVPLTLGADVADGTDGETSYFRVGFDPTSSTTTDDPPLDEENFPDYEEGVDCPELVCSPLSDDVHATPRAGTFTTVDIDQSGPVVIAAEYGTAQLTATGTFNAAGTLTQKITDLNTLTAVTWTSADSTVASVSNVTGTKGRLTAFGCPADDDDGVPAVGGVPSAGETDGTDIDADDTSLVTIRLRGTGSDADSGRFTAEGNAACVEDPLCEDVVVRTTPAAIAPPYCAEPEDE